jgi:hypothetical protein
MEHCTGSPAFHNRQVQECFGTGFAAAAQELAIPIDRDQVVWCHQPLIHPAWGHQ